MKEEITIKEAQEEVDKWIKTIGVRYFSELTNMAVLTEEVGELARVMSRAYGDQSFKNSELSAVTEPVEGTDDTVSSTSSDTDSSIPNKELIKEKLGDEMADVLWVLICLANQTGIDLTEAFQKNMEKKTERDGERHINNEKLKV